MGNNTIEGGAKAIGSDVKIDPLNPGVEPDEQIATSGTAARAEGGDAKAQELTTTGAATIEPLPAAITPPADTAIATTPPVTSGAPAPGATVDSSPEAAESTEELPDNKWTRYYYDLKKRIESNPNLQSPISNFMLSLLLLAAKYSHFADLVPGRFRKSLDEDEDLKDKKLDNKQIEKVLGSNGVKSDDNLKAMEVLEKPLRDAKRKLGIERASTKFACNALWGILEVNQKSEGNVEIHDTFVGIDNAASLAASLLHTSKISEAGAEVPLYTGESTLEELKNKADVEIGTIIVFIPNETTGEKVIAYADGSQREGKSLFKYYDPNAEAGKKIVEFSLSDEDSPIKSEAGVQVILTPNIANYKAAQEANPSTTEAEDKPVEKPEDKPAEEPKMPNFELQLNTLKGVCISIKAGVVRMDQLIKNLSENPAIINELNIPEKIKETEANAKRANDFIVTKEATIKQSGRILTDAMANEAKLNVYAVNNPNSAEDKSNLEAAMAKTAEAKRIHDAIESSFRELESLLEKIKLQTKYFQDLKKPEAK